MPSADALPAQPANFMQAGLETLRGATFKEIAPMYPPELVVILQTICDDQTHPIVVMVNDLIDGEIQYDDDGTPKQKPTLSHVNILYHIVRVWNPFFYGKDLYIRDPILHYHRKDVRDVIKNIQACVSVKGHEITSASVLGIIDKIANHTAAYPFSGCIGTLNFSNGVFNAESGEITPNQRGVLYDYVISTPYKTFKETTELYAFLDQYGNREPINVLAKALWQRCNLDTLKELTIFYGDKDSGKTTSAELIQATLDGNLRTQENTGRVLLHELLQRFGLAALEHKSINIGDDLPDMFIRNSGRINELLGSVHHNIEKKGIDHFTTTLPAYNLFTTNHLPPLDDDDSVIWSKIHLVRFEKTFSRGTVRENLYTETIKEQLLFRAVELMQTWKETPYKNDQTPDQVRAIWNEASTSTDLFMAECLSEVWVGGVTPPFTPLRDIELRYSRWCIAKGKTQYLKFLRKVLKPHLVRKTGCNGYRFDIIQPTTTTTNDNGQQNLQTT